MAWNILFTSDIGLLSLFTILFCLVMGGFIFRYVMHHMADEEKGSVPIDRSHAH